MDFFAAQDHARRTSRLLVLWFMLAVAGIIATVYLTLVVALGLGAAEYEAQPVSLWDPELLLLTAAGVGGIILLASTYKVIALSRNGGPAIAEELGGRLVSRSTADPLERRLINVVEEMALASGIPAPPVYVLDAEQGINAFAAGSKVTEAVVAVTRGTLEQLSRDELQGVVAHEFSHILNGDMRLNLRLIGVLHGILLLTLAGRVLMRSARGSDRGAAPFIMAGLALVVVGYLGVFFGKLIKAGVSRQREYLADASAVQFTRNPAGISGALKRIAGIGSEIHHPRAEEASHMFFGSSAHFSRLLATHPPIETRIKRIDPSFNATAAGGPGTSTAGATPAGVTAFSASGFADGVGNVAPEHMTYAHQLIEELPEPVVNALHQPGSARAVVFALLISRDADVRDAQLSIVEKEFGASIRDESRTHAQWLHTQGSAIRLPLIDLALPTLSELSTEAREQVLEAAEKLIAADRRTSLFEYVLRRLLHAGLRPTRGSRATAVSLKTLKADTARLLGLLARAGGTSATAAAEAFAASTAIAPLEGPWDMASASEALNVRELDRMLSHLAGTRSEFRRKLVEACATAIMHDGKVTPTEAELLRAVCQAFDCPTPPVLQYADR